MRLIKENKNNEATKPVNYRKELQEYIDLKAKHYVKNLVKQMIIQGRKTPQIRFELKHFIENVDDDLIDLLKKNPEKFLEHLETALIELGKFNPDFKQYHRELIDKGDFMGIHIIPDCTDVEFLIPEQTDLSQNFARNTYKLFRFKARFLSLGLERSVEFRRTFWHCRQCGKTFYMDVFRKTRERYKRPSFCMDPKCNAKTKSDFILDPEASISFEKRTFTIVDLENRDVINEIRCYIDKNIHYFEKKAKDLHPNDEVEVMGILKMDVADLESYKDEPRPRYYIDVIDLNTEKTSDRDSEIIKQITKKLKDDDMYCNKILDAIHPYSQGILNFFPIKLIYALAYITSDSWDEIQDKRNSLNGIVGGHAGTLKSNIGRKFRKILGKNKFGIIFGKNTTAKGLVPVAQRNNTEKNLIKRYGAIPYYNRKTFLLDEAHYLWRNSPNALESFKYFEDGTISRALDGTTISAEAKGSFLFALNYFTNDEAYNYTKTLIENLGFPEEQQSIIDRIDLHYRIPRNNKMINSILLNRDSKNYSPEYTIEKDIIYNYLIEAKRIYPDVIIPRRIEEAIEKLYAQLLSAESKGRRVLNPREPYILKKCLKAIAALRFKKRVNENEIDYLKRYLIDTIIPFQDNKYIRKLKANTIDLNEVFRKTFKLLTEIKERFEISDHIEFMKSYLNMNYFEREGFKDSLGLGLKYNPDKVETIIGKATNKANRKYRELLENSTNREFIKKTGYIIKVIGKTTNFYKKGYIIRQLKTELIKAFHHNNFVQLDVETDLITNLELILEINIETIKEKLIRLLDEAYFDMKAGKISFDVKYYREKIDREIRTKYKKELDRDEIVEQVYEVLKCPREMIREQVEKYYRKREGKIDD